MTTLRAYLVSCVDGNRPIDYRRVVAITHERADVSEGIVERTCAAIAAERAGGIGNRAEARAQWWRERRRERVL